MQMVLVSVTLGLQCLYAEFTPSAGLFPSVFFLLFVVYAVSKQQAGYLYTASSAILKCSFTVQKGGGNASEVRGTVEGRKTLCDP